MQNLDERRCGPLWKRVWQLDQGFVRIQKSAFIGEAIKTSVIDELYRSMQSDE